jgi:hypothetical protein
MPGATTRTFGPGNSIHWSRWSRRATTGSWLGRAPSGRPWHTSSGRRHLCTLGGGLAGNGRRLASELLQNGVDHRVRLEGALQARCVVCPRFSESCCWIPCCQPIGVAWEEAAARRVSAHDHGPGRGRQADRWPRSIHLADRPDRRGGQDRPDVRSIRRRRRAESLAKRTPPVGTIGGFWAGTPSCTRWQSSAGPSCLHAAESCSPPSRPGIG